MLLDTVTSLAPPAAVSKMSPGEDSAPFAVRLPASAFAVIELAVIVPSERLPLA